MGRVSLWCAFAERRIRGDAIDLARDTSFGFVSMGGGGGTRLGGEEFWPPGRKEKNKFKKKEKKKTKKNEKSEW